MREWEPYEFTTEQSWDECSDLAPESVSKMLVVGDVHGDSKNLTDAIDLASDLEVGAIVQVGDFWLADLHWSRLNPLESQFMWAAHDSRLPVVVVDGNHEVWPALGRYALTPAAQAASDGRRLLAEAVEHTQPAFVLHGHWHHTNRERINDATEVLVLRVGDRKRVGVGDGRRLQARREGAPG